jgi:hypothetical protein
MHRVHLPIADPCHEDWDAMSPVDRGRFCRSCDKQVFDLSSMTKVEAHAVLRENGGQNICVRYCHDDAGNIRFRTPAPARAAALALAMAACTPHERPPERQQVVGELIATDHEEEMIGKVSELPTVPAVEEVAGGAGEHELMGDVAPTIEPEPEAEPPRVRPLMGKPVLRERKGDVAVSDEPCDAPKPDAR